MSQGQNHFKSLNLPCHQPLPWPRISSPACARSGDGTHYRWETTPGNQEPGLASAAGKSALICPFNKTQGVCAPPLGKRAWKGAPSGQGGQATRRRGFRGHQSPWGEALLVESSVHFEKPLGLWECISAATHRGFIKVCPAHDHATLLRAGGLERALN